MATQIGDLTLGNGVNLQPTYFNEGNVNFGWDLMQQQAKIKTVRIEIDPEPGGGQPADWIVTRAAGWIAAAQSKGYQVIATYHKNTAEGSDDVAELIAAANWWASNYQALGGNFIINLMNEWGSHDISATAYALAYNQALAVVRTVYNGPVIIDLCGWGQDINTVFAATTLTTPVITDPNIILSVHIYPDSWNSGTGNALAPSDLDTLSNSGKPCIVGEFGNEPGKDGTNNCDWQACVAYAGQLGWTVMGWCWNGDGRGYNMVSPSWNDKPTATDFTPGGNFDIIYNLL
jgi:hypothetical protein